MASTIDNNLARPIDGSDTPTNVVSQAPILSGGDVVRTSSMAINFDCSTGDGSTALTSGKTVGLVALPANSVVTKLVVWQIDAFGAAVDFGWEDSAGSISQEEDDFVNEFATGADTVAVHNGAFYAGTPLEQGTGMPPLGASGGYLTMTAKGSCTAASKGQLYVEYITFGGTGSN